MRGLAASSTEAALNMRPRYTLLRRASACLTLACALLLGACAGGVPRGAEIRYPPIATVAAPRVLAQIQGVRITGGFGSALALDPRAPGYFYMLTDRGPNADGGRPEQKLFPLPDYAPQIGRFKLEGDALHLVGVIELKNASGRRLTGLPNSRDASGGELPFDREGRALDFDPEGLDSEGLVAMPDGTFWISDEYGPWLVHVDGEGRTLERVGPFGADKSLPRVLASRRPNRGMEALALTPDQRLLVGLMQSALDNPDRTVRKTSRLSRLVTYDHRTGATRQYAYTMATTETVVSDIAAVSATSFLVLERDGLYPGAPMDASKFKRIYRIDIAGATDISDAANSPNGRRIGGKTLEQSNETEMQSAGIVPVTKRLLVDLLALPGGYPHDKPEGLAIINPRLIAVSNDDDFGIAPDGKGGIGPKRLPADGNRVDVNRIYFIRLDAPLE